jgi:RNA polymerase sigma factor (sigma-70 family)
MRPGTIFDPPEDAAFRAVVARFGPAIHAAARSRLRDHHLAEDAAQTVFILLWGRGGMDEPTDVLRAWILQTVRLVCSNIARREARRRLREARALRSGPERAEPAGIEPAVHEALDALEPEERRVLELRFFESRSLDDVGQRMGISLHAAAMRIGRALAKLQRQLRRRGVAVALPALAVALPTTMGAAGASGLTAVLKSAVAVAVLSVAGWLQLASPDPEPAAVQATRAVRVEFESPAVARRAVLDLEALPEAPAPLVETAAGFRNEDPPSEAVEVPRGAFRSFAALDFARPEDLNLLAARLPGPAPEGVALPDLPEPPSLPVFARAQETRPAFAPRIVPVEVAEEGIRRAKELAAEGLKKAAEAQLFAQGALQQALRNLETFPRLPLR